MDIDDTSSLMKETIASGLSALRSQSISIYEMQREPFLDSSSFSTELLRVQLDNDEWLNLFFKDLNPANQLNEAKSLRSNSDLSRSYREFQMYKYILPQLRLGTPQLFACRWEPQPGHYWLFIEDVGSRRLSRSGDFKLWLAAAQWAARFHATVYNLQIDNPNIYIQYDRAQYYSCAEHVKHNLTKFDGQQQPVIRQALDVHEAKFDQLLSLPRHLIHGEFFGENIMLCQERANEPIAVIDWETASIAPGYVDLVSISAGIWALEQKQAMWRAYFEQYQAETGFRLDWEKFYQELGLVALFQALSWLGWWSNGDEAHINRWVTELNMVMTIHFDGKPS